MTAVVRPLRSPADGRIRPLPIPAAEKSLREAMRKGWDDGERYGYVAGWRWGYLCGLVSGVLLGMLSLRGLIELGMLIGGAP